MDAGHIIIVSIASFILSLYVYARRASRRQSLFIAERAARSLGLEEEKEPVDGSLSFAGHVDGRRVRLVKKQDLLLIAISIDTEMPDDMRIIGVSGSADSVKSPRDCDIVSGDEAFNSWLSVRASDSTAALAFLDARARKTIIRLYQPVARIEVTPRALILAYNTLRTPYHNRWTLVKSVRAACEAVKALEGKGPIKDRLIAIMGSDPYPFIRLAALRAAAARFPADPEVLAAVEKSLNDQSLPVMLEAVRILGEKGAEFLLNYLLNRKGLNYREIIEIIGAISEGPKVAGAAGVLEKVFMKKRRPAVRKALLDAFARLADTSAGPFLASQLGRFDSDLHAGVIEALATCGTVEAVEPLLAELKGTINPFARSAVEKSIASIQSRLDADRGWLSVGESATLEGALSPGGIEKGSLSLEGKKK